MKYKQGLGRNFQIQGSNYKQRSLVGMKIYQLSSYLDRVQNIKAGVGVGMRIAWGQGQGRGMCRDEDEN